MVAFSLLFACAFLPHNSQPFVSEAKTYPGECSEVSPCSPDLARPKPPLGASLPPLPGSPASGWVAEGWGAACENRRAAMETVKHRKAVKSCTAIC